MRSAWKSVGFGAREDAPLVLYGGPWQRFGNTRAAGIAALVFVVFMPL